MTTTDHVYCFERSHRHPGDPDGSVGWCVRCETTASVGACVDLSLPLVTAAPLVPHVRRASHCEVCGRQTDGAAWCPKCEGEGR